MRVVLTGASGCLGQAVVAELTSTGSAVTAIVRPGSDIEAPVVIGRSELDLSRPLDTARLPPRCDAVVHLAQSRAYRDFPRSVADIVNINVAATVALAKYAIEAGAKIFIFASSGSVYLPSRERVSETAPTDTRSFYAGSKIAAEILLRAFDSSISVIVMRLFSLYGPGQTDKVIAQLASRISEGKPIDLYGTNGHQMTPTFTGDVAHIMGRAILECWPGGIYNVAAPDVCSLRDISLMLANVLNRSVAFNVKREHAPLPTLPDLTKLKGLIGNDRFITLEEGLQRTFVRDKKVVVG
jgi:nucleoside-diphosphate-sugar epimerase